MSATLITTATGIQKVNSTAISWEQEFEGPVQAGNVLMVFVGGIDSQKPEPISATFSGSAVSPLAAVDMTTAISLSGPGGSSFPCAWIFILPSPMPSIGTVTGTISIEFDDPVARMTGISAVISGVNGTLDGPPTYIAQHTQLPDFSISGSHTTTGMNTVLVDMCMSESSNHQGHLVGENQNKFGSILFTGPKYSTSFKDAPTPGDISMIRTDVGGPFAGVSLITIALESE